MAVRDRSQSALSRTQLVSYVTGKAPSYGVDPQAALAVATQEGIGGGVGDQGTSFGPWQLHAGGALPADVWAMGPQYAQEWAWSPAGVDYALAGIGKVSSGQRGLSAVESIVRRFERPADPGSEVLGAEAAYGVPVALGGSGPNLATLPRPGVGGHGGGWFSGLEHAIGGGLETAWNDTVGAIGSVADFLKLAAWLVNPLTWLRAVETLFGFVLLLAGLLVILGADKALKQLPGPTGAAAKLAGAA